MLYKDNMNANKLIDFMRHLAHDSSKKVFLILDNLRVHHAKKVTAWLEKYKDEIEVFYLSPYTPEYKPDELLNSDLKRGIGKRPSPRSDGELEHNVRSHLKSVQLKPKKIQGWRRGVHGARHGACVWQINVVHWVLQCYASFLELSIHL